MKVLVIALVIVVFALVGSAQTPVATGPSTVHAPSKAAAPLDLARAALTSHGGDKLRAMRSLVQKGSLELNVNNQNLPAAFSTAISGNKYFFEIISPFQQWKQVYDGQQTYSSIPGFSLPPVTSLGFPLLARVGDTGYLVSGLGEGKKGKRGFRVTTPEGFYTDFYVHEKSGQIKGYDSSFETAGRVVTTSVEIEGYQTVDGITVPTRYSQRFDLGQVTAYANFKTKELLLNSAIDDKAFTLSK